MATHIKRYFPVDAAGFEGFFEETGAFSPQQQQDIPRGMEMAEKYGLEFLPPPGA
jgi:hypothetical protein